MENIDRCRLATELRGLFLSGKLEAFRERAVYIKPEDWSSHPTMQSLKLLYETVILKKSPGYEAQEQALIEQLASWLDKSEEADSESLSEVALAAMMLNALPLAEALLDRALSIVPVSAYAHFRMGTLFAIQNHHEQAVEQLHKGLAILPDRAEAWANLAHVYKCMGEEALAQEAYIKGWELSPAHQDLAKNAIEGLKSAERLSDYRQLLTTEIEAFEPLRPLSDDQKKTMAFKLAQKVLILEEEGELEEALVTVQQAVNLLESEEAIRRLFIDLFLQQERYWILGQRLKQWVDQYDVFYEHLALAQCRIEADFIEVAKEGLLKVKDRSFGDPEWDNLWAQALMEEGDYVAAKETLEVVHEKYPDYIATINLLADVLASLGELDRAMELTQQAADKAPGPLMRLLENKKKPSPEDAKRLEDWLVHIEDESSQANIRFTLAHVQDRLKQYEEAAENIAKANKFVWQTLDYDPKEFSDEVDQLVETLDADWVVSHANHQVYEVQPVFIVGMPRSGTTLLEQIFAAHPAVFGGGELPIMPRIRKLSAQITSRSYPGSLLEAKPKLIADAAAYYLDQARASLGFSESVLVDKLPHNFLDAGMICAMFPNARVIALRRDYRAIGLSNYFQNFAAKRGMLGYSFDLEAMGHHLSDFHRLMNHWKSVLPKHQYQEFYYEELVSNPKDTIPAVLEFCGLDFTSEVMDFYRNKTAVRTASVRQVRNPIYQGSKDKWRHYEQLLAPMIEIVEASPAQPYRMEENEF